MERFAEDATLLQWLREYLLTHGVVESKIAEGKEEAGAKYADYFDYAEPINTIPSHRALAMLRGRREGMLHVSLRLDSEAEKPKWDAPHNPCEAHIAAHFGIRNRNRPADAWLSDTVRWTWRVKSFVHLETELMMGLRKRAETEAIDVFARNLKALLLAAPAGQRVTMGLDPGLRTGVKVAVVDATGKVMETATIYPHQPRNDWDGSLHALEKLAEKYGVSLIAIGNGTASRETDKLARDLIKRRPELKLTAIVVSEAGASVYSASEFASRELPSMDVSLRGAVSIARRLQDPLAELVKVDPKSIGVGQYQHDVGQAHLARSLDAVVEDCVNAVGVDVNTASPPLLERVSGLNHAVAQSIVAFRDDKGRFASRAALREVPRLGEKAFEQAAGFLRIMNGDNPLDASAVHPESYPAVEKILADLKQDIKHVIGNGKVLKTLDPAKYADEKYGIPTITDILGELEKPGRDPRPEFTTAAFKEGVNELKDLRPDMISGRCRDQRRRVWRIRRHRRAPGRAGAHLRAGRYVCERPAYGSEGGAGGESKSGGDRRKAQAHRADHADGGSCSTKYIGCAGRAAKQEARPKREAGAIRQSERATQRASNAASAETSAAKTEAKRRA